MSRFARLNDPSKMVRERLQAALATSRKKRKSRQLSVEDSPPPPAPEPQFSPSQLNPVMWFDAADSATIQQSGGRVSQWNDKSASANHLTQPTAARQPGYRSDHPVAGSKPAVFALTSSDVMSSVAQNMVTEWFIVCAYATGVETTFVAANQPSGGGAFAGLIGGTGTSNQPRLMGNSGSPNFITSNALSNGLVSKNDAAASVEVLPLPLSILRTVDIPANAASNFSRHFFNQGPGSNRCWPGPICEILAFSSQLSTEDRGKLQNHLKAKWGTP